MMQQKKTYLNYFMAFIIPFLFILIYFLLNSTSFYDLFISDLRQQYIYLFDYFKDIFDGNASLFYSFSKGIGGSMYGTFFYYLSSPLNLFLLFFSKENLHIGIGLLIFIKIGLCSLTMFYYLDKQTKISNLNKLLFSISYALMIYNIIYFFCIMWLDIIILAPLVILGLDKILENKKSSLYIIFLFLSIVSNYYMAYMLCIFCVIYLIYKLLIMYNLKKDKKIIKEIILKFIIHSLLAGLLAAFMILPVLNELLHIYREELSITNNYYIFDNLKSVLRGIGLFNYNSMSMYYYCYIFPGFYVFTLLINYIFFIKDKEKKYIIGVLLILLISILIPQINYVWHCFTNPMLFQNRFSFLIPLFLIITLSQKMDKFEILKIKQIFIISIIYIAILSIPYILDMTNYSVLIIITNFFLLFSNLYLMGINKQYKNIIYKLCILFITLLYSYLCLKYNFINGKYDEKKEDLLNYRLYLNEQFDNYNSNYYRIDGYNIIGLDELWNLKNGSRITYFISSNNQNIMNFYTNVGYNVSSTFASPESKEHFIINGLLGIKYWYNDEQNDNYVKYDSITIRSENIDILKSKYYKSIGYVIKNKNIDINKDNTFLYQNSFTQLLNDINVYEECKIEKIAQNKFQIKDQECLEGYIYIKNYRGYILIDDIEYNYSKNNIKSNEYEYKYMYMKRYKFNHNSIIEVPNNSDYDLKLYKLNMNNVSKLFNNLNEELIVKEVKNNKLKGNINLEKDGILMITIPYEDGFKVYVDGIKVDYYEIFDTFIGLDLTKGEHKIELIYETKYLKLGIIISIISFLVSIIYLKKYKYVKKMSKNIKKIMYYLII